MRFFYLEQCTQCNRIRLSCRLLAIVNGNLNFLRAWRRWFHLEEAPP